MGRVRYGSAPIVDALVPKACKEWLGSIRTMVGSLRLAG